MTLILKSAQARCVSEVTEVKMKKKLGENPRIVNICVLFLIKLVKYLVTAFLTVVSDLRRSSKHIAEASKSKKPG